SVLCKHDHFEPKRFVASILPHWMTCVPPIFPILRPAANADFSSTTPSPTEPRLASLNPKKLECRSTRAARAYTGTELGKAGRARSWSEPGLKARVASEVPKARICAQIGLPWLKLTLHVEERIHPALRWRLLVPLSTNAPRFGVPNVITSAIWLA